ncbi:MAG: hypothetical protein ACLUTU_20060 [Blautia faecis]
MRIFSNLIAVVFITLSIGKMIVNSINTFADALNGISMFGSSGVIGYIIVTAVVMVIMLVLEIVSCFLSREKKNAMKVVVSENNFRSVKLNYKKIRQNCYENIICRILFICL